MARVTRRTAAAAAAQANPDVIATPAPAPVATAKNAAKKAGAQAQSTTPLDGCVIALSGTFPGTTHTAIQEILVGGGATISRTMDKGVTHLLVTPQEFAKQTSKVKTAQASNIPILQLDWAMESIEKSTRLSEDSFSLQAAKKRPIAATVKDSTGPAASAKNDDEEPQPKKRKAGGRKDAASSGNANVDKPASKEKAPVVECQVVKAKGLVVPADNMIGLSGRKGLVVYTDPNAIIYDVSLNQTNAKANHNKFYLIQLVVDQQRDEYYAWTRWGRVGETGQHALLGDGTLDSAIKSFEKKFKDKSGLYWENRTDPPKPGKYAYVEKSYDSDSEDEDMGTPDEPQTPTKPADCTLEKPVQELVALIFNQSLFNTAMASLNYDANKLPLGKLGKSTILRGFQALKDLSAAITASNGLGGDVEHYSNLYYSLIPHAFGRNRPPIIADSNMLKNEIKLLESLSDMKAAADIMKDHSALGDMHHLDRQFRGLGMEEMTVLSPKSTEFKYLAEYLNKSKGSTHHYNYTVTNIFRIERVGERDRFAKSKFAKINSDRRLLWHGSRCTNFGGILSQGLRIAPPEAPVSGYMFGKGIYLADMSSKSAGYCASSSSNGEALLLLCEAELGDPMQKLVHSSYNAGESASSGGMVSTWGVGRTGPREWIDAGVVHPSLEGVMMPDMKQPPGDTMQTNASLLYNEYICYDVAQVQLRYLFRVNMNSRYH